MTDATAPVSENAPAPSPTSPGGRRDPRAGALLPLAHRHPARRPDPHRPVQLGLGAAHRRDAGLPHRGHGRQAGLRGVLPAAARSHALARHRLGRGRRGRRPARALPPVPARGDLRGGHREAQGRRAHLPVLLLARGDRGAPPGRRARPQAGLRRLRPRPHGRAGRRVRGRGPRAGVAPAHAGHGHHLHGPRARGDHVQGRHRAGLRGGARGRLAALHAGQPRGRRPHGHHPRAARRGPALLHPARSPCTAPSTRSAWPRTCRCSATCPT